MDWFRNFLVLDSKWDWLTLTRADFELLFEQSVEVHASIYGGDDPDLSGFRRHAGRLLIVHGLADEYVPPQESIAYYENVQRRSGGPQLTNHFIRLFLVPGGNHGFGSPVPTPSPSEMIGALLRWVESGTAPVKLIADLPKTRFRPARTRPLFPYPQEARYVGKGNSDEAANFAAMTPTH